MREVDLSAAENRDPGRPVRIRQQLVGEPASVENLERAGHGGEGATGRVDRRPALQNGDRPPATREVAGGGHSRRAATDNEDVDFVDAHRATASGCGYQRRMSSGVATAARLKTKRQPGCVVCAALTIDSNSSVLLATRRTPAPMSTAS